MLQVEIEPCKEVNRFEWEFDEWWGKKGESTMYVHLLLIELIIMISINKNLLSTWFFLVIFLIYSWEKSKSLYHSHIWESLSDEQFKFIWNKSKYIIDTYNFYKLSIHSYLPVYIFEGTEMFNFDHNRTIHFSIPHIQISQFIIYEHQISFIFNILHIYNYQGERTHF